MSPNDHVQMSKYHFEICPCGKTDCNICSNTGRKVRSPETSVVLLCKRTLQFHALPIIDENIGDEDTFISFKDAQKEANNGLTLEHSY